MSQTDAGESLLASIARLRTQLTDGEDKLRDVLRDEAWVYSIVNCLPMAVVVVNESGVICHANQILLDLLDYGEEDLVGHPIEMLVPPDARGSHAADREAFVREPATRQMGAVRDLTITRADSSLIPVEIGLGPLPTAGGLLVVAAVVDISKRREAEETLSAMALRDGLTGLWNRRAFDDRLGTEWRRAARSGDWVSLILCDIDHLKAYNDHHGPLKGDECLRRVGAAIGRCFQRASDLVCRWGGEEFAVIISNANAEASAGAAERLRVAVAAAGIQRGDSYAGVVTVSVGVASCRPKTLLEAASLKAMADRALHAAKEQGRNRVCAAERGADDEEPLEPHSSSRSGAR